MTGSIDDNLLVYSKELFLGSVESGDETRHLDMEAIRELISSGWEFELINVKGQIVSELNAQNIYEIDDSFGKYLVRGRKGKDYMMGKFCK